MGQASGAPLIEPSPTGDRYSLVTFVWRGSARTRNVVIADGVAAGVGGAEAINSQLLRLTGTDVWYRTYDVRNDARFTYKLAENDSLRPFNEPNRLTAVGAMEIPQQLDTNRRFREALVASGATVEYREFNGNHAYLPWRGGFADGLVSLFGSRAR